MLAPSPVPELASLFKRTNASILAKMANVDGSRPHGARQDPIIATTLLARPADLQAAYLAIMSAAKSVGIGHDRLPDFLDLEVHGDLLFLGQDEIEPDLESAVQQKIDSWGDEESLVTQRLAEVNLRVGQHRFAAAVLANFNRHCGFCGMSIPEGAGRGMLRASHIKSWAVSNDEERLDVRNGIAACPTHDAAFDSGLLTVNGGLRIHVSQVLADRVAQDAALRHAFGRPPLGQRLLLPTDSEPPSSQYLRWHREHVWAA
jgi:putative restriction endonuclease